LASSWLFGLPAGNDEKQTIMRLFVRQLKALIRWEKYLCASSMTFGDSALSGFHAKLRRGGAEHAEF
jgi:hypothetical protein